MLNLDWSGRLPVQPPILDRLGQVRLLDRPAVGQVAVGDAGDLDVQVDAVEQGAGEAGSVALE
jgi:hypothetical protein